MADGGGNLERRQTPVRCDGCGRGADVSGMTEHGWAISPISAPVPGIYCLSCASALQMLDWFVRCVECGATAEDETVAESLGWRFYPDQLGQLQPHCALCTTERRRLRAEPMSFVRRIRWYAELARDLVWKPPYRPAEFWEARHSEEHTFWTVGRRSMDEPANRSWYARLEQDLVTELDAEGWDLKSASVCEIGAGIGYWTRVVQGLGCRRYLGIEIAESATKWLRTQFPEYEFVTADVSRVPIAGSWDVILMMHVDEHIHGENFLAALRHIQAAMTPTSVYFTTYAPTPAKSGVPYVEPHGIDDFARVFPASWIKRVPEIHGGDPLLAISQRHADGETATR